MVSNGEKVYSVAVLGAPDAGKSSLLRQFFTSEYSDSQAQYFNPGKNKILHYLIAFGPTIATFISKRGKKSLNEYPLKSR